MRYFFKLITIKQDKANHIVYGSILFLILKFLNIPLEYNIFIVTLISLLKEVIDYHLNSEPDFKEMFLDFIFSEIGLLIGILCSL